MMKKAKLNGFTLQEVLIVLILFSLITALFYHASNIIIKEFNRISSVSKVNTEIALLNLSLVGHFYSSDKIEQTENGILFILEDTVSYSFLEDYVTIEKTEVTPIKVELEITGSKLLLNDGMLCLSLYYRMRGTETDSIILTKELSIENRIKYGY